MKLWIDTEAVNTAGRAVRAKVSEMTRDIDWQVRSRATRAVDELRNAEQEVLKSQGSGRVYRKYPFKSTYRASAPGEPPVRRSGSLRLHWNGDVETRPNGNKVEVFAVLESCEEYSKPLDEGAVHTKRGHYTVAPRPFRKRILETAAPKIKKIYEAPYR